MAGIQNNIRALRLQANVTQEEFAEQVGVTRQTIIAIEKGNYKPTLELAFKISRVFKKSIENVFTFNE